MTSCVMMFRLGWLHLELLLIELNLQLHFCRCVGTGESFSVSEIGKLLNQRKIKMLPELKQKSKLKAASEAPHGQIDHFRNSDFHPANLLKARPT